MSTKKTPNNLWTGASGASISYIWPSMSCKNSTQSVHGFRCQKNQPLLIYLSRSSRDLQKPKTKLIFQFSLFQKIPFLYFFLHKSWIWQTLGHVMNIFSYWHFHNASKEYFWSKKTSNFMHCTGSKVPFWQFFNFSKMALYISQFLLRFQNPSRRDRNYYIQLYEILANYQKRKKCLISIRWSLFWRNVHRPKLGEFEKEYSLPKKKSALNGAD